MPVVAPPAPGQFVGMTRRDKAREDRLSGMALGDLDDDRQNAIHPRRVPGRVLGKQILHVDAEMRGFGPEPTKAQRVRLCHTRLTNAGGPRVPASRSSGGQQGREFGRSELERESATQPEHSNRFKPPQPLSSWCRAWRAVPHNLGCTGHLQYVAAREIDDQQTGARIGEQVAEGVEEAVAAVIRDFERPVLAGTYEAGAAAAVGDIDAASRLVAAGRGRRRDKRSVGTGNQAHRPSIAQSERFGFRKGRTAAPAVIAPLNILRTIAEALLDQNGEAGNTDIDHSAVHAIAAARRQLDAEQTNSSPRQDPARGGIDVLRIGADMQNFWGWAREKARFAGQNRRPGIAQGVE